MRKLSLLATLACMTAAAATAQAAAPPPYVLRDTTSFPPPAPGTARLVVARERLLDQGLKPEFVFVDRTPIGHLPRRRGSPPSFRQDCTACGSAAASMPRCG
jgi:hypothetical protein